MENLYFNILTINWPNEPVTLYFSLEENGRAKRLYKNSFTKEILDAFPEIELQGLEFIYTSFKYPKHGFMPVKVDLQTANADFVKHYYRDSLSWYFKKDKRLLVKNGYIENIELWIPSSKESDERFNAYERFSLRVQYEEENKCPSIILSYEHHSKVFRMNYKELTTFIPSSAIGKVIYGHQIIPFEKLQKKVDNLDYEKIYPILRREIVDIMGMDEPDREKVPRYNKYYDRINTFYKHFIKSADFEAAFPGTTKGFMKVPATFVNQVNKAKAELSFEDGKTGQNPKKDFRLLHPAVKCPYSCVNIIFVYHKDDKDKREELAKYLTHGLRHYKGLLEFSKIPNFIDEAGDICFTDKDNPMPEFKAKFDSHKYNNAETKYFAIYLTPFTKAETRRQKDRVYIQVKEFLLNKNIVCQGIEPEHIGGDDFVFTLTNMSVAILAKLEGLPWRLKVEPTKELVIGVGAHRNTLDEVTYVSSAFCFDNSGRFNAFDYFIRKETKELAGLISLKVREFVVANGTPTKLVIHFYKTISKKELEPIERALAALELPRPIPIFIVSINKTASADILAFDKNVNHLMPDSGVYIKIGKKKYLLFNNARNGNYHNKHDGYHFPLKMAIDCNNKELLEDTSTIHNLITQVYQFSRLYYKSLAQQNLPVTIKYSEIIAGMVPYFKGDGIPEFAKDKLWFI